MSGKLALVVLALCLAVTAARGQETESARLRLMQLSYVSEGSAAAEFRSMTLYFEGRFPLLRSTPSSPGQPP